jgi:hypothetical protein
MLSCHTREGSTMDDQQILTAINGLRDVQLRQVLRAQFQREGQTEALQTAVDAALARQAQSIERQEAVMRPARWMARKTGGLLGRTMRKLEEQAEKQEREGKQ